MPWRANGRCTQATYGQYPNKTVSILNIVELYGQPQQLLTSAKVISEGVLAISGPSNPYEYKKFLIVQMAWNSWIYFKQWTKLFRVGNWLRELRHWTQLQRQRHSCWPLCLGSFSKQNLEPCNQRTHWWSFVWERSSNRPSSQRGSRRLHWLLKVFVQFYSWTFLWLILKVIKFAYQLGLQNWAIKSYTRKAVWDKKIYQSAIN